MTVTDKFRQGARLQVRLEVFNGLPDTLLQGDLRLPTQHPLGQSNVRPSPLGVVQRPRVGLVDDLTLVHGRYGHYQVLKLVAEVSGKLESSLVRFLAHDFLDGPRQRRALGADSAPFVDI